MVKTRFIGIVACVIFLDQLTKFLVQRYLSNPVSLIPNFLSFTKVQNYGAGFGTLTGQRWILIWTSIVVIGLIIFYYDQLKKNRITGLASALILGGAMGNLIDRLFLGYVIDFMDFSFWPAFNVADSAITIGASLLVYYYLKKK